MIQVFKTIENKTLEVTAIEPGCWVHLQSPTDADLDFVAERTGLLPEFLRAALDEEESSRLEVEGDQTLVILDIPIKEVTGDKLRYLTYPLGIILNPTSIVTVCLKESRTVDDFKAQKVKTFGTHKKGRFILQMLNRISAYYLAYLKEINRTVSNFDETLHRTLSNRDLIQLLSFEKALVYFSTSLKSNDVTLEKMMKLDIIKRYPDDRELLEDVIIENKQAIEMASIYSNTLNGTMNAYASIVSNNLNLVVKFLTSITIVLGIPTAIAGFYGMNVALPYAAHPMTFWGIVGITSLVMLAAYHLLVNRDMF